MHVCMLAAAASTHYITNPLYANKNLSVDYVMYHDLHMHITLYTRMYIRRPVQGVTYNI